MIYEYVCSCCNNKFEVKATLEEKEKGLKPECPNCYSKDVIRVFGQISIKNSLKNDSFSSGCCTTTGCDKNENSGCC